MNINKPEIKPNILIVDDIKDNLFLIKVILNNLDVNFILAESGLEALSKIKDMEIALALLDIHMPKMNGIELAEKIQNDNSREKIPIIFLTAYFLKDEIELEKYYESGAVDFIQKPFRKNILISKVKVFLELFRQKQQIREQKLKIENTANELENSLEQLHQLTKYIEKVREEERLAISRELHDDLGQALTAIKIDLGIIRQSVPDKEVEKRIIKTAALVSDAIKTVQKITFQLRPKIIDDLGLEAGIEWYTKEFSERNGIEIILDIDSDIVIHSDVSLVVFRIMQESLTNVSRHAKATQIDIQLSKDKNYIILLITDNGIGISESQLKSKTSFGIIGMKERADYIGGTLDVYNHGSGTSTKLFFH